MVGTDKITTAATRKGVRGMTEILRGNLISAPELGRLEIVPKGYVALEDGVIASVGGALPPRYEGLPVTDYGDCLVLQSFADLHLHAPQYPMLGMGMDLPLLDWLNTYTFKTESKFSDLDFARKVYGNLARELIALGTTRVSMFSSRHTDATFVLMEELEKAGAAGFVGKVNMDRNGGEAEEATDESISETLRWLDGCHFGHIKPILTPRFTPSCTDTVMEFLGGLAKERGLRVQSHLSENTGEIAWVRELHPDCRYYWETYDKYGLWNAGTLMAHCVHSGPEEQAAMAQAGVIAVHCAASNVNLCSGTAPVREMIERGVTVAMGTDIAGGDQLSMARAMATSIRASKIRQIEGGDSFLTVPEAYYLASGAGHAALGGKAGFQVGDALHAIVVDDGAMPAPARELSLLERFERALYLLERGHIRAVYSDGRKVKSLSS